jgi:DNA-binding response OmpR family regulator
LTNQHCVLDLGLPDMDAQLVLKQLRVWCEAPIMALYGLREP